ncbi:MAG TPA: 4Fe-4S binding protein [Deinococcales bacterium]|nr:4Fe-4S binding protein [Deinococcales bacterium]
MLKTLYNLFTRLSDVSPEYHGSLCLLERNAVGGCSACQDACPHEAIRLTTRAEVMPDACTGCGLCVQACPTGALAYPPTDPLALLNAQDHGQAGDDEQPETFAPARLACSRAGVEWPRVPCLARVQVSTVLASAAWRQNLALAHASCSTCDLGGPGVPRALQGVLDEAEAYKRSAGLAAPRPGMVVAEPGGEPATSLPEPETVPEGRYGRREAMRALGDTVKSSAVKLVPEPLARLAEPQGEDRPEEWHWRRRALAPRAAGTVYWPAPRVNDDCIDCPVCENVCPTRAITRTAEEDGTFTLTLVPAECTGCNACVLSCPPQAMRLEDDLPAGALGAGLVLRRSGAGN